MEKFLRDISNFVFALIEVLLIFRFVLKLLAASPDAGFVAWVYANTRPLIHPFLFAFPTPSVTGGFTLEFTTIFAIFAYAFIGYLVGEILKVITKEKK